MKVKPSKHSGEVLLEVGRRDESLLAAAGLAPFKLKKILVPTDFSDCSQKALQYALPFARQHEATITLLYVVPTPPYVSAEFGALNYPAIEDDMRSGAEQRLAGMVEKLNMRANTAVRSGSPGNEIVRFAKSLPADIVVISTHGHSGLKHVLLGSVAEYVVRHAPCPVLIVREREHEFLTG